MEKDVKSSGDRGLLRPEFIAAKRQVLSERADKSFLSKKKSTLHLITFSLLLSKS